jgi:hypothetical protein
MRDFLDRHQDKLIFGSDCQCMDGHGTGVTGWFCASYEGEVPGRETWTNGTRLLKIAPA